MPRPAVFFDRDNTLIRNSGYLRSAREVVLLPGAADAVAACRAMGFAIVTVSNQSGVARAMMSESDVRAVNARMDELLLDGHATAVFDGHYFCPYHPDPAVASVKRYCRDSEMRKPRPGMLLLAAKEHGLDLSRSWLIGDAPRDIQAAHAAGCRAVLLRLPDLEASPDAAEQNSGGGAEFVAASLAEAVGYIDEHAEKGEPAPPPGEDHRTDVDMPPTAVKPAVDESTAVAESAMPFDTRVLDDILGELRRQNRELGHEDAFSVAMLLAGVMQILAIALLLFAYFIPDTPGGRANLLFTAIFLQVLTATLVAMGKGK